jgi:hypothetical protein
MSLPPSISKITLFSVLPVQTLFFNLDLGVIADPTDRVVLHSLWEKANKAYASIGPESRSYATSEDLRPIEKVAKSRIESLLNRIKLYSTYDSHPTYIYNVRISKLVTPQLIINLPRAQRRSNIKKDMTPDELFDLSFESTGISETITRQTLAMGPTSGAILFNSYDEDMRFYNPPQYRKIPINEKDPDSPTFQSVCIPVGGGYPFASAYRVQIGEGITRLILNNGIHRVYKLAEAGHEWCPLVVSDLAPMEVPDPFVGTPKHILLDPNSNPPLITDFLNKEVVIPLKYYRVLKTVRFNWNFEQYETVLK